MSITAFAERKPEPGQEQLAKLIFGSPKKLAIGIWIVGKEIGEPFSVTDVLEAYTGSRHANDGQISPYLRAFSDHALLDRLEEPELRLQRYTRVDHVAWGIFEAAKHAFENSKKPQ